MSWSPSDAREGVAAAAAGVATVELTVPELGAEVPAATILAWGKQVGDWVSADEPICRLAVGDLQVMVHSTADGELRRVFATVGASVGAGDSLAELGATVQSHPPVPEPPVPAPTPEPEPFYVTEPSAPHAEPEPEPTPEVEPVLEQVAEAEPADAHVNGDGDGVAADDEAVDWSSWHSPIVQKLAEEHGVDLSTIVGTGTAGRIRKRDVLDLI